MNTEQDIKKFLLVLSEAFPGQVKASTLEVYYQELRSRLQQVNLNDVKSKLICEGEFFPSVKKILEVVKHRRELERAMENKNQHTAPQDGYVEAAEFFKQHNVSNFIEYLEKQKHKKGAT